MRRLLVSAGVAVIPIAELAAQAQAPRFREDFRYTLSLKAAGKLHVENFNGAVHIAGWNQNRAEVTGTKYAPSKDLLQAVKVDVEADGDSLRIRTERSGDRRGDLGARYLIRLPRRLTQTRIENTNGAVQVENLEGEVRLRTSNGSVRVAGLVGQLEAETSNAGVDLQNVDGELVVRTSNGSIRGQGVRGTLDARTSNGAIQVAFRQVFGRRPIRLITSNQSIDLQLPDVRLEVEAVTSNAGITVRLPANASADLRAEAPNGSITTDFDVRPREPGEKPKAEGVKTKLEGIIGRGGPRLEIKTTNGPIRLLKPAR
ncbi:MAG: hypothetical protein RMK57_11990 [Bryobacterales bacterium]|nr:hypothetical protein [Bryobacteraceae bacterium]MDW8355241.1 hypothetical protein [Bryobacterales bacterium]